MRDYYYNFIKENSISDILSLIPEISYSHKIKILTKLLEFYSIENINFALNNYKLHYINLNRIDINRLLNILKFYAKISKNS